MDAITAAALWNACRCHETWPEFDGRVRIRLWNSSQWDEETHNSEIIEFWLEPSQYEDMNQLICAASKDGDSLYR